MARQCTVRIAQQQTAQDTDDEEDDWFSDVWKLKKKGLLVLA